MVASAGVSSEPWYIAPKGKIGMALSDRDGVVTEIAGWLCVGSFPRFTSANMASDRWSGILLTRGYQHERLLHRSQMNLWSGVNETLEGARPGLSAVLRPVRAAGWSWRQSPTPYKRLHECTSTPPNRRILKQIESRDNLSRSKEAQPSPRLRWSRLHRCYR